MSLEELKQSVSPAMAPALVLFIALVSGASVVLYGMRVLDDHIDSRARAVWSLDVTQLQGRVSVIEKTQGDLASKLESIQSTLNDVRSDVRVIRAGKER